MALRLFSALTLGESQLFVTPHTSVKQVTVSILLQKASATLGHPKAVPNTNFIRKLYATPMEAGETLEQSDWERAVPDLASIDAHSAAMAMSQSHNVSDRIHGGVVKKSVRSYYTIVKRMPIEFNDNAMDAEELTGHVRNIGKRGVQRTCPGIDQRREDDAGVTDRETQRQFPERLVLDVGARLLREQGRIIIVHKMYRQI